MPVFTVEIATKNNGGTKFAPTQEYLRGRWDSQKVAGKPTSSDALRKIISNFPRIPGIQLALDSDSKRALRLDPLQETDDGKRMWKRLEPLVNETELKFDSYKQGPWPAVEYNELDHDQVKGWMFYMRDLLDAGLAEYATGSATLPTKTEIRQKVPGKLHVDPMRSAIPFDEGAKLYRDDVPIPQEPAKRASVTTPAGQTGQSTPAGQSGQTPNS